MAAVFKRNLQRIGDLSGSQNIYKEDKTSLNLKNSAKKRNAKSRKLSIK